MAMRAYEASPYINAFSSKYDAVRAGSAKFSSLERRGYALFRGKARCNECHRDSGESPLFTDFTADNLGVPRNSAVPFYAEDQPDAAGYAVNRLGARYVDDGVGAFIAGPDNPNRKWAEFAESYRGKFQASSLRNVDQRPRPDFIKAYMHNGYFKSLKEVVHFYNTRDVLPRCKQNDPGEKVTCWPAPEQPANVNNTQMGHLGLSNAEEDAIVAFLKTLTDGYEPPAPSIACPTTATDAKVFRAACKMAKVADRMRDTPSVTSQNFAQTRAVLLRQDYRRPPRSLHP
jgi:cytochrome c peroxidase